MWTVYKHPRDYPGHWVLRAHDIPGGPRADCKVSKTLDGIRKHIPPDLIRLTRYPDDDPVIFETWI
jgi:hypothetical protein